jgi:hypothetical protein
MSGLHADFRRRTHHGETRVAADGPCEFGVEQTQGRFEDETCSGLDGPASTPSSDGFTHRDDL